MSAGFTSSDASFSVADASQLSPGLIEVDEELLWCDRVDPDANLVYVTIRGFFGSTAAAHSANAIARNQPKYPRFSIKRAINDVIRSTYPDLFAVGTTTLTTTIIGVGYELPADVEEILDVTYSNADDTGMWYPVNRYRVTLSANTTEFATGKSIEVYNGIASGRTVQVVYKKVPSVLAADADLLTASGLSESAKECIVYGVCARLVGYIEPARINDDSAEAKFIDGSPAGQALTAARYFYQMFAQARAEEARRLLDRYPPRIHFNR